MDLTYGAISIRQTRASQTVTYEPVTHTERRIGNCPECGKRRERRCTFEMTVNPFNKDPETGLPRTYRQVVVALNEKGEKWQPDFTCKTHAGEGGES